MLTFWFTGLPASGKTSLGSLLHKALTDQGLSVVFLDGDEVRKSLCNDLGFSNEDRIENIRRISSVAKLINDSRCYTICCFVSPTKEIRDIARNIIGEDNFIEIFVDADVDVCIERDPKHLYKKAMNGEMTNLTGVNAPFEPPMRPSIHLNNNIALGDSFYVLHEQVLSIIARKENIQLNIQKD